MHGGKRLELSRPFALSRPGVDVVADCVEHEKLVRAAVCDDDPPVGQPSRVVDLVQLVFGGPECGPDNDRRFGADPPVESRPWSGLTTLDDRDAGAVSDRNGGRFGAFRRSLIATAGSRREGARSGQCPARDDV